MEAWQDSDVRSSNDDVPAAYVADGAWPHAVLREDAPVSAHYGQALARRLADALAASGTSLRALGERAGVNHTTVSRLLGGRVLVDIGTVARISGRGSPRSTVRDNPPDRAMAATTDG
jgi:hypothetical protein